MWSLPPWINPHLISIALHSLHPAPQPSFELSYLHVPLWQDLCPPTWNSLFTLPSWHLFWFMLQILIVSSPAPQKYLLNDIGVWRGDSQVRIPLSLPGIRASWERRDGENNQMEIKNISFKVNRVVWKWGLNVQRHWYPQYTTPKSGRLNHLVSAALENSTPVPIGQAPHRTHLLQEEQNMCSRKERRKGSVYVPPSPTVKNLPLTRQPGNPLHLHRTE